MSAEVLHNSDSAEWIAQDAPPAGTLELLWLGQAGFVLKTHGHTLVIDPYVSDSLAEKYRGREFSHQRMMEPPISPQCLAEASVDMLFSTHAHTDHLDPGTLREVYSTSETPIFIGPRSAAETAAQRGVPLKKMVLLDAEEQFLRTDVHVTALASAHEQLSRDECGNHLYLGYVISIGGIRIYHSGDAVPYEGLARRLAKLEIDIALLPVNGRDAYRSDRGIPGNFTIQEACTLIREGNIGFWVPHHFGMFAFNSEDPKRIREVIEGEGFVQMNQWLLPEPGVIYRWSRA